jgi:glycine dehydrogenase subunit 2
MTGGSDVTDGNAWKNRIRERYQQQRWQEHSIYDLGSPGERGILPPAVDPDIKAIVGDPASLVPEGMLRKTALVLPEVAQPQIMRHYTRLSQEMLSEDSSVYFGMGTCSMKYNPKVNERLVNMEEFLELHPRQDEETVQGILEVMYSLGEALKAISGLDAVSLQPASGSQGVFSEASIIRKFHDTRGIGQDSKSEIITSIFSHPCNPATPHVTGYDIITIYPDERGYGDLDKYKAAVSERTAGLVICCPDDTGILNPNMDKICDLVHEAGGLCVLDSANANGSFGWYKASDVGFDMTQWNLHKSFGSPHGMAGPGAGPIAVKNELAKYLPKPVVAFDEAEKRYYLDWDRPDSIGKVRSFYGNIGVALRALSWVLTMGPEGLRTVTDIAVLNNNYMRKLFEDVRGLTEWYTEPKRMDMIRWSFDQLMKDTGVGTQDVASRLPDYGIATPWLSHTPWLVPEPMTPEPTETYARAEVEEFAAAINRVSEEAYSNPELVKTAPHRSAWGRADREAAESFAGLATSRRAWLARHPDEMSVES